MSETDQRADGHSGSEPNDGSELRTEMARSLACGGLAGVQLISWETADVVPSPKRRALIETLQGDTAEAVRGLDRQLNRAKGQVSRGLGRLAEYGIVRFEESGRVKRPLPTREHSCH